MILIFPFIIAVTCAVWLVIYMRKHIDISIKDTKMNTHDNNKSERPNDRR
jgi:hypothetical protein